MNDIVSRAKALAIRAHAGQVDKAGRPYIEHVTRVAAAVSDDPVAEAVAWLHDVLEDCRNLPEWMECMEFRPMTVPLNVMHVTRENFTGDDFYYENIRRHPIALRVKLADIADNSSEERLALLDEKTAARLRRKYANAISALTGGDA